MTTRKLKGGVGRFKIYNTGKMQYSIMVGENTLAIESNVSAAYRTAERFNLRHANGAPMFNDLGQPITDDGKEIAL